MTEVKIMDRRLAAVPALALMASLAIAPAAVGAEKVTGEVELAWNECFTGPGD